MSTSPAELVALRNVSKSFPDGERTRSVLDSLSFGVAPGEVVALLGPSGSGKTTALNIACGLLQPDSGDVLISDETLDLSSRSRLAFLRRCYFGILPQHGGLIDEESVASNLALPVRLGQPRLSRGDRHARVLELLKSVDALPATQFTAGTLSGGERQRVLLARALANEPKVLLADEPSSHLDAPASRTVLTLIRRRAEAGMGALIATHDPLVLEHCDRAVEL
ncbi:ABC transporter ATP-binding protein [Bogoriella caseilytica]|uniref:Putative ABC transport system ATP-binding protein n=1 Tax=Bogoriella caseilytica TaxID=56055 RepID=A0A3N2BFJ5_9MICO|nr:ATP-binding cassette domain-containing protein [Bogoriella caseilytica]ROR74005.1 putative ABC transport system ATP-binding protein [Bogoriella caseilytica]